jgi:hypothetical protein
MLGEGADGIDRIRNPRRTPLVSAHRTEHRRHHRQPGQLISVVKAHPSLSQ